MLLDSNLCFDPAGTALTASAASTNVLDLLNARDLGIGSCPLKLIILSDSAFASSGSTGTLNIQLQGAPDNGSGAPGTWTTYAESGALTQTQLNGGGAVVANAGGGTELFGIDLPPRITDGTNGQGTALPRFLRLNYVVASGPFTAGHVQAYLGVWRDFPTNYPSGFAVNN